MADSTTHGHHLRRRGIRHSLASREPQRVAPSRRLGCLRRSQRTGSPSGRRLRRSIGVRVDHGCHLVAVRATWADGGAHGRSVVVGRGGRGGALRPVERGPSRPARRHRSDGRRRARAPARGPPAPRAGPRARARRPRSARRHRARRRGPGRRARGSRPRSAGHGGRHGGSGRARDRRPGGRSRRTRSRPS